MSAKNLDKHNRFRNRQVAFRLSPQEADLLDNMVAISGLTKQDYIIDSLLTHTIIVNGNPRVHKALRDQMAAILEELKRIEAGCTVDDVTLDTIRMITTVMDGMKEEWNAR